MKDYLKDIKGTLGNHLEGKKIVLCITGSVSAIESPHIARKLMRYGAEVSVVMTRSAGQIIHPDAMEWATGNPVVTHLGGKVEHILLAGQWEGRADLVLVAPATANTISKTACGVDDTPVTTVLTTAIGSRIPVIIAPGMHLSMYEHPIVAENIEKLKKIGVKFIDPVRAESKAKIALVDEIVEAVIEELSGKTMKGFKVLVSAGPTVEFIDPVRVITNRSSGRMGIALAREAKRRGAEVTLVYGHGSTEPPSGVKLIKVSTTGEMKDAVLKEIKKCNLFISSAAVADFTPSKAYPSKISTRIKSLDLKLIPTPKIIAEAVKINKGAFLAAFKAQYNLREKELIESSYQWLKETGVDLVVANDVSKTGIGFAEEENEVYIIDKKKEHIHVPRASKEDIASKILDFIEGKISRKR